MDGHGGALWGRIPTERVAVFCLDVRVWRVQIHIQQWVPLRQQMIVKETVEKVIGEILHLLREMLGREHKDNINIFLLNSLEIIQQGYNQLIKIDSNDIINNNITSEG